ncbi:hypothetical protein D3C73_1625610 [compost metagenome]
MVAFFADALEEYQQVLHIKDNYQRQITCHTGLDQVIKLRLEVLGTNGLDHARVFEIRCH